MATLAQLEAALVGADKAGDMDAARRLAALVVKARAEAGDSAMIPGPQPEVSGTEAPQPSASASDMVTGAAETGAALATGATTGMAGYVGGILKGLAEQVASGNFGTQQSADAVAQSAMQGAQALTYQPKSQTGQGMTEAVGQVVNALPPVLPMGGELGAVAQGVRSARPMATAAVDRVAQPIANLAKDTISKVTDAVSPGAKSSDLSAGAAQVNQGTLRQAAANELPVPIKLTEGQKTRAFEDQRFEQETAKLPEQGAAIRQRFEDQNAQLVQNMDSFIDQTGAQIPDVRGVGELVDKVLTKRAETDKARIRVLYKDAEKAGELETSVELPKVIQHLNESASLEGTVNSLPAIKKEAVRLGLAMDDGSGTLVPRQTTLKSGELFRQFINDATDSMDARQTRQAAIIKGLYDAETDGLGGNKYKQARAARVSYAKDYENAGLIKRLLGEKRGTDDRAIALEDVVRKLILDPATSLDQTRHVRKLLQTKTGGATGEGAQAWKELQGATLRHIQDQMTKNVTTNQRGDRVVSAAQLDKVINQLDKNGKLDFVFGKKGAEQLRTINDVAKTVLTAPPGTVNTSNTASVLAGLMDVAISGSTGIPAPIATSFRLLTSKIKDAKLKAKIAKTLGE
jgi:hypothetical protein